MSAKVVCPFSKINTIELPPPRAAASEYPAATGRQQRQSALPATARRQTTLCGVKRLMTPQRSACAVLPTELLTALPSTHGLCSCGCLCLQAAREAVPERQCPRGSAREAVQAGAQSASLAAAAVGRGNTSAGAGPAGPAQTTLGGPAGHVAPEVCETCTAMSARSEGFDGPAAAGGGTVAGHGSGHRAPPMVMAPSGSAPVAFIDGWIGSKVEPRGVATRAEGGGAGGGGGVGADDGADRRR